MPCESPTLQWNSYEPRISGAIRRLSAGTLTPPGQDVPPASFSVRPAEHDHALQEGCRDRSSWANSKQICSRLLRSLATSSRAMRRSSESRDSTPLLAQSRINCAARRREESEWDPSVLMRVVEAAQDDCWSYAKDFSTAIRLAAR